LFFVVVFIITVVVFIAVPCPRVFHNRRRKSRIDCRRGVLKSHGSAHFALALLQVWKPLAHLMMRLSDEGFIGLAH
jgi:hypothetical protein